MPPTIVASVIANLVRLGFPANTTKFIAEDWIRISARYSLDAIVRHGLSHVPVDDSELAEPVAGTLFMSCHFGSYAHLVASLAKRAPNRKLYVVIGDEPGPLRSSLSELAKREEIDLEFILGGYGVPKRLATALRAGYPALILIDVPRGDRESADAKFPLMAGEIIAKTALFRLADRIGAPTRFVLAITHDDKVIVKDFSSRSQADCFRILDESVRNYPHMYERLFQLHRYYRPTRSSNTAVVWSGKSSRYAMYSNDMSVWDIGSASTLQAESSDYLSGALKREVQHVVCF